MSRNKALFVVATTLALGVLGVASAVASDRTDRGSRARMCSRAAWLASIRSTIPRFSAILCGPENTVSFRGRTTFGAW
jgi:hypothetical protein